MYRELSPVSPKDNRSSPRTPQNYRPPNQPYPHIAVPLNLMPALNPMSPLVSHAGEDEIPSPAYWVDRFSPPAIPATPSNSPSIMGFSDFTANRMHPGALLSIFSHYFPGMIAKLPPYRIGNNDFWRALIIHNTPRQITHVEVLRQLRPGGLESIRHVLDHQGRSGFELRFVSYINALAFYAESHLCQLSLNDELLEISWGPTSPIANDIKEALKSNQASRTLQVKIRLAPGTEPCASQIQCQLKDSLGKFGIIESIKPLLSVEKNTQGDSSGEDSQTPEHSVWIVNYTSIASALKAMNSGPSMTTPEFSLVSVKYGRDLGYMDHILKKHAALLYLGKSPYNWQTQSCSRQQMVEALAHQSMAAVLVGNISGSGKNIGNRCICISKLPNSARMVDVCNTVRGGMLESIKLIPQRNLCFITFLEASAAAQFWATYQVRRLYINSTVVRIGWGWHSGPLRPELSETIASGVSRNLCLQADMSRSTEHGTNIDSKVFNEQELERLFAPLGTIEQIRIAPEVGCSFVSFANISNALQAADWAIKTSQFTDAKVKYGKDRCAALPRSSASPFSESQPVLMEFLRLKLPYLPCTQPHQCSPMSLPILPLHLTMTPYMAHSEVHGGHFTAPGLAEQNGGPANKPFETAPCAGSHVGQNLYLDSPHSVFTRQARLL